MEKHLKINEMTTLPKSALFPSLQRYRSKSLITKIEELNEDFIIFCMPYLLYLPRNKSSKSVTVGPGLVVPNDSASPEIVIQIF